MKSIIRVCAASAVGIAIIFSVLMWSHDTARGFWVAWNEGWEWRDRLLSPGHWYPTSATALAAVTLAVAAYHCIQLRSPGREDEPEQRICYIAAAHSVALLLLCYNAVSIFRHWLSLMYVAMSGYSSIVEPILDSFWPALPILAFLVLTVASLGKHIGRYLFLGAWMVHIAVIGAASTALAVQLFMLMIW